MVWSPVTVIGPSNPANEDPGANTKVILAFVFEVRWVLRMWRPFGSIHVVASEVVVPFIFMPWMPPAPPARNGDPPAPAIFDRSGVIPRAALLVVSTAA